MRRFVSQPWGRGAYRPVGKLSSTLVWFDAFSHRAPRVGYLTKGIRCVFT